MPMDQEMPAEGAPQAEGGGNSVAEFVQNLGQGIATLGEMVAKTEGAPPEAAKLVEGLMAQFDQLIQVMSGGGGEPQEQMPQDQRPQAVPVQQAEGTPV